jgi:holo-ACP synthase CitX
MAPSSMPYEESKGRLLAARDARQAALARHRGAGRTLVALSLAIPGADKQPPGAGALFAWAAAEVGRAFPGARLLDTSEDALGPFALWAAPGAAADAKAGCTAIEASRPAARLVDLDVYSPEGASIDRASLHLPPRACLCCDEPARECILLARHGFPELVHRALGLLAGLSAPAPG